MTDSEKIDLILSELQTVKQEVQVVTQEVQVVKQEVQVVKQEVQVVKQEVQVVKQEVQVVTQDMQTIKQGLETVTHKVTLIGLTMENELQPNIMRVAEGHIDLFRNLSNVKSAIELVNGTLEMNDLFIRHHDAEIKKLKAL